MLVCVYVVFFLNYSLLWNFSFFFPITYIIILFSITIYLLPILLSGSSINYTNKVVSSFYIMTGGEITLIAMFPVVAFLYFNFYWTSPMVTSWFGHVMFGPYQSKMLYILLFFFVTFNALFFNYSYLSSGEVYDFIITKFNILYWTTLLYCANSLFSIIFVIEVISTLIFLVLTTSTFSTVFFYKNINFDSKNFFHNTIPYVFLQSILFYFWVSLISSLNLFVFLMFFYTNLLTLDFFLVENVFNYLILVSSTDSIYSISLIWFVIIFSVFLKCGIAPLFIWKPTFFKGLSFATIAFYVTFVYFTLFVFFINFLNVYFHELFFYYSFVNLTFISLGLLTLFFILCESFFFKTFLAVSSILNSLLVLLSMSSIHSTDLLFFL
jgi:hypothetical protein